MPDEKLMGLSLIGRDVPRRALRSQIERAVTGQGGLVLVTGEAGIGKTSLVRDAVGDAARRGMRVLCGACWGSAGTPGYWPWTQALRGLRRDGTDAEGQRATVPGGGGLAALLGADGGEAVESFRLFDAVTTGLVTLSRYRPLLVVLEDLHWADAASLGLLDFAAQHIRFERLLVVGTYRDVEVQGPGHPLRGLLQPLATRAATVGLAGLPEKDVAELMLRAGGARPSDRLVKEVHRLTGGNPFFVEETARSWSAGHPITRISPGVRTALRRRVSQLSEPVVHLLGVAAVLGRRFDAAALARRTEASEAHVTGLLSEALESDLVRTSEGTDFAFTHGFLRQMLYDSLEAPRACEPYTAEHAPGTTACEGLFEFTRDGPVWRLTYGGRTVHVPDAKGLRDLHRLLGAPGSDMAAVRLLNPQDAAVETAGSMGADTVLDDEARTRYRRRLDRLDEAIDRAVELGRDDRAAEYDRERQALIGELRRATGLAGRARRLGDPRERARKTVTARIRNALRRIEARHPELAAHLRETVSTGTMCRYAPGREIRWRL